MAVLPPLLFYTPQSRSGQVTTPAEARAPGGTDQAIGSAEGQRRGVLGWRDAQWCEESDARSRVMRRLLTTSIQMRAQRASGTVGREERTRGRPSPCAQRGGMDGAGEAGASYTAALTTRAAALQQQRKRRAPNAAQLRRGVE
jgi:hypothetical protein